MSNTYVVALDQGTTSSRAILFNQKGEVCGLVQRPFKQIFPQPGWVEHDPQDILSTQLGVLTELLVSNRVMPEDVNSIGITNQRETTIVWDRETGVPVFNAIVWQCRRTAALVDEICKESGVTEMITRKTGLIPDAYFSASKISWILDNVEGAREKAEAGKLCFGTVDSWLIWSLTYGAVHATDPTNASRTMLYDIHKGCWDQELLDLFDIPVSMMPEVRPSSGYFGTTSHPGVLNGIDIRGVAGDQQAALFGQCCFEPGQAKNTYGTGCFMLMNTGDRAVSSHNGLVTTIAASAPGCDHIEYALEGSVFIAGALIQWLRDEMGIIKTAAETEKLACSVEDNAGVYIVPAFTGLGAPYWDADARGVICGLTRGTNRAHIARAALEALAYQSADLLSAMESDAKQKLSMLHVDGGASANNFLMQFQSDILDCTVNRPVCTETTALGAAFLAGLSSGFWKDTEQLRQLQHSEAQFQSTMNDRQREILLAEWHAAVRRTRS